MLIASVTSSIESFIGNHGIYAVFVLMMIDAVFPAASELVMVYGGALASGAFSATRVDALRRRASGSAAAPTSRSWSPGRSATWSGAIVGWAIGDLRRPALRSTATVAGSTSRPSKLDRAERWFDRFGRWAVFLGRVTPVVRSFVSIPAGVFETPVRPATTS